LAKAAEGLGQPLDWFEALYREAADGTAVVPWADMVPNPHLVSWLETARRGEGLLALDVGSGFGDNAEAIAAQGYQVTAFDLSPTAVEHARRRFPESRVDYRVGNLLEPDPAWRRRFDLVFEVYTIQVLQRGHRRRAIEQLGELVAPGGTLLVVARGREPSEPEGEMPWPLTRDELGAIAQHGLELVELEDFLDEEDPPVRRFRATYQRGR
jgi:SAM-dependent methyltransferase